MQFCPGQSDYKSHPYGNEFREDTSRYLDLTRKKEKQRESTNVQICGILSEIFYRTANLSINCHWVLKNEIHYPDRKTVND